MARIILRGHMMGICKSVGPGGDPVAIKKAAKFKIPLIREKATG